MEARTVIPIENARKILREFNAPSELYDEATLIDIINRLDSIANLYIIGLRDRIEPPEDPLAEGSVPF